jgi:hypothetical protein
MEHANAQLVSLPALAASLRLPEDWLKAEANAGRLPHLRIGKRYRFSLAAVEAVLIARATSAGLNAPGADPQAAPRLDPAVPDAGGAWRAAMVARLAEQIEAVSRRHRARAKRSPRLKTNTAGGLPPRRPSDDRPNPPVKEGSVDG